MFPHQKTLSAVKQEIACPVCDSHRYEIMIEPWVDVQDAVSLYGATSGVQGTQRLVTCLECGLIYENPRFAEDVILLGYQSYQEETHDSQYAMRVDSFYRALLALRHLPPKGAKVLDVGTASGGFLEAAQRYGYEAIGLEPSRFMVQQGVQRGLNILEGTLENHSLEKEAFDLVCLWDVLEHVPNPKTVLIHAKELIKPDGLVLINYPDIGTWMAKLAGRRYWWILSVHLLHFSRQSIRRICELTGLEAFYFQSYWQTLQFGYLEEMAVHLKVPLSGLLHRITPHFLQNLPIPYYASQTTVLARVSKRASD